MTKKKYCVCGFPQSEPPHVHSFPTTIDCPNKDCLKDIDSFKYVLVVVYGGLIDRIEGFRNLKNARKMAEEVWEGCNPETDDVKVLDLEDGETILWMPPKDGNN